MSDHEIWHRRKFDGERNLSKCTVRRTPLHLNQASSSNGGSTLTVVAFSPASLYIAGTVSHPNLLRPYYCMQCILARAWVPNTNLRCGDCCDAKIRSGLLLQESGGINGSVPM